MCALCLRLYCDSDRAGVGQGGILPPVLFAVYVDVLVHRLKSANIGRKMFDTYYGCLLCADDIILMAHTSNSIQQMLNICRPMEFGDDYDVKFNDMKSLAMRVGPRFNVACKSLELGGKALRFVYSVEYLGINILAWRFFKCSFEHVKLKFFRVFNCIYAKSKAADSEVTTVELFKSYCLPHITYAREALPFSNVSRV